MALQMDKRTDIVVTVLNHLDLTKRMVESIRQYTSDYRLIIVDGGSTDGTAEWLASQPDIVSITNSTHTSYSKAINQGLNMIEAPYIALLNNDVEVDAGWLDLLIGALEQNPTVGAVGPLSTSKETQWEGRYRARTGIEIVSYQLAFFAVLLRRKVIEQIGLFDEGFDSYGTDNDYAVRMRQAGWQQAIHCGVLVKHDERSTIGPTGRVEELRAAARQRLREKWPNEGF